MPVDREVNRKKYSTGKTGLRGVKGKDKMFTDQIFIGNENVNGKFRLLGNVKMHRELVDRLSEEAKILKTTRSQMVRDVLDAFLNYQEEARLVGNNSFFKTQTPIDNWLNERHEVFQILQQITELNNQVQENSQSPEVKSLSNQMKLLSKMINYIHKTIRI